MDDLTFEYREALELDNDEPIDPRLAKRVAVELAKHIEAEFVKACGIDPSVLAMRSTLVSGPNGEFYTVTTRKDERGVYLGCMVNLKGMS